AYGSSGFQYRLATTGDYQPSLRFPWLAAVVSGVVILLSPRFAAGPEDRRGIANLNAQASLPTESLTLNTPESPADSGSEPPVTEPDPPVPKASVTQVRSETAAVADEVETSVTPEALDTASVKEPEQENVSVLEPLVGDHQDAFATLFGYWQVVYPQASHTGTPCDHAEANGLNCIYGRGDWQNLEYYNRPAILELLMEDGQLYQVVVSGLDSNRVTLDMNGRRFDFTRDEIDRLWTGSYLLLWRPPKLRHESLQMGQSGTDVVWLISMLDRVEGVKTGYDPRQVVFDETLQQRVINFQRKHALLADGIVGKQTLIQLNQTVMDSTRPVLVVKRHE
ncbi:MAG: peptidoglycan-binding domain-containing protein, partial [Candidatus Thiodiazotropha sp.]